MRISHQTLQTDVEIALDLEGSLDASAIVVVIVGEGSVVLRGSVPTIAERELAARTAAAVRDVTAVRNLLDVEPGRPPPDDAAVADACRHALAGLRSLPPGAVEVQSVVTGVVVLRGAVDTDWQREQAEQAVCSVVGVRRLVDEVRLALLPAPVDAAQRVAMALAANELAGGAAIEVTLHGRTLQLDGIVRSSAARELAGQAALGAPGVAEVENHIAVVC
jgi:osmotically-inducible protein OsmY